MKPNTQIRIGAFGPPVFLAAIVFGTVVTPGYSQLHNAVSELTEAGAARAGPIGVVFLISGLLNSVLGYGVWQRYAGRDRVLALAGLGILSAGVIAMPLAVVFRQDPMGSEATLPGVLHLVLVGVSGLLLVAAILLAGLRLARVEGGPGWFGGYSLTTVALMALGGLATPLAMQTEPMLIGLTERVTLVAYQTWLLVFALVLMREDQSRR